MIVSRTPLRISFFSGGSDLPAFYSREPGAALSVTIDKYIWVIAHDTPYEGVKSMYDVIERVDHVDDMEHAISRECLKRFGIENRITVASVSDIAARGSGLGSSSAFTAGLVACLMHRNGSRKLKRSIAEAACDIEMNLCGFPVGKQDAYAAAYGGLNLFEFSRNGRVTTRPVEVSIETRKKLEERMLLVYSGRDRSGNDILSKQQEAMIDPVKFEAARHGRDKAFEAEKMLLSGDVDEFCRLFHSAWVDKKQIVSEISPSYFDGLYERALDAGALGGKLLGAGGGGFFLFLCPPDRRNEVSLALTGFDGSKCAAYGFKLTDDSSTVLMS